MAEAELDALNNNEHPRRLRFDWLLPLFFRPRRTLTQIGEQNHGVWLAPLLVLTLLVIISALAAHPIRQQAAQMGSAIPPDFQYWSTDQQQAYMDAQANSSGPMFTLIFPALSALLGLWVSWFLLGSILHLALTLTGSRSSNTASLNLAAWASLPFLIGFLVQAVYLLSTGQLITAPGLAGFASADGVGLSAVARPFLGVVDLYWIWHIVLLLIGAVDSSGTSRLKTVIVVLTVVLLVWVLRALPGILAARLSSMPATQPFFFY